MEEPLQISPQDKILEQLNFKPYRSVVERRVIPFMPAPGEPQTMEIDTPWGVQITARRGDFLVSETGAPDDFWPIDAQIFEESYIITRPGYCIKRALIYLAPLVDATHGVEDRLVTIETVEGRETVRAGDFYLARGIKGEIWPYPKEKVESGEIMVPAE